MALVKLKYDWFAPNAQHFGKGVVDVPEHLLDRLPSTAKVLDHVRAMNGWVPSEPLNDPKAFVAAAERLKKAESLKDHDGERAAADAEAAAIDEAERERLENRRRLEAKLAAEKGGKK